MNKICTQYPRISWNNQVRLSGVSGHGINAKQMELSAQAFLWTMIWFQAAARIGGRPLKPLEKGTYQEWVMDLGPHSRKLNFKARSKQGLIIYEPRYLCTTTASRPRNPNFHDPKKSWDKKITLECVRWLVWFSSCSNQPRVCRIRNWVGQREQVEDPLCPKMSDTKATSKDPIATQ